MEPKAKKASPFDDVTKQLPDIDKLFMKYINDRAKQHIAHGELPHPISLETRNLCIAAMRALVAIGGKHSRTKELAMATLVEIGMFAVGFGEALEKIVPDDAATEAEAEETMKSVLRNDKPEHNKENAGLTQAITMLAARRAVKN